MAHCRLALTTMLDWIERCLAAGEDAPTDAEICERYGFDRLDQARGLLADLSDQGKITIRWHDGGRSILLGRVKGAFVPAGRVEPSVRKADPSIDQATATIAAIVNRGRKAGAALRGDPVAAAPPACPTPAPKPQTRGQARPQEDDDVNDRSKINFGGDALDAIKRHAEQRGVSMAAAATELVKLGALPARAAPASDAPSVPADTLDDLLDAIRSRFAAQEQTSVDAAIADVTARAEAAEQRADAAEARLEKLREAFAA